MNKTKAIIIDFTILIVSAIFLVLAFYIIYELFPTLPRLVLFFSNTSIDSYLLGNCYPFYNGKKYNWT